MLFLFTYIAITLNTDKKNGTCSNSKTELCNSHGLDREGIYVGLQYGQFSKITHYVRKAKDLFCTFFVKLLCGCLNTVPDIMGYPNIESSDFV